MSTFLISITTTFKSILIFIKKFVEKYFLNKGNPSILLMIILFNAFPNSSVASTRFPYYLDFDEIKTCLSKGDFEECKKYIFIMEKLQIKASNEGIFKCQTTLLGIQSELIKNIYFEKNNVFSEYFITSNLIKNC